MKSREPVFDPRRLDVRAFSVDGISLSGEARMDELPRLAGEQVPHQGAMPEPATVRWQARGLGREQAGGERQAWIDLQASTSVALVCQRCLEPVIVPLSVERQFQFVRTEAEAERLDAEVDHEVLTMSRDLDLVALLEDELLLGLPLVPRHAQCQVPGDLATGPGDAAVERVSGAFAALGALKRSST